MKRHFFRCDNAPGTLTPQDQVALDTFRASLAAIAAVRDPEPWTPGHYQALAVRIGLFIERTHPAR